MSIPILATKFYIPPTQPNAVLRLPLIERLNEALALGRKLILVSAPAGSGKTTLVSEWISHLPKSKVRATWLSLDEEDSEPIRFLAYLIAALQTINADIGNGVVAAFQSNQLRPIKTLLMSLLNEIAVVPDDFILVLDDYHLIDSKPVDEALAFLLDHLPPQMHLVITTREDPQLPISRLRARGQLTELRTADLRFTPAEAAEFLNQVMGLHLSVEHVIALETRTEGWITGLQLAALSLQNQPDPTNFIDSFTGGHHFVLDYLVDEVLRHQPEPVRSFLLQSSILERLTASLCEAVTGQQNGKMMLENLGRANLFVVPLDDKRHWYRYHHLFAEVLQVHLCEQRPDRVSELHRRASIWYEQNELEGEAIQHALAAEDWERAAKLIELAHPAMDLSYQSATWLAWVRALPEELIRSRPVLCADIAWALLDSGELETCEAYLQTAENWLESTVNLPKDDLLGVVVDEAQFRSLPASINTARAYRALALGDVPGAVKYAQQALTLTPENDPVRHLQAVSLLGVAQYTSGDLEAAEAAVSEIHANLRTHGDVMSLLGITYLLADIRVALGRLYDAEHTYQQAIQLATGQGDPMPVGTSDLYRGISELTCEWDNLEAAEEYLNTAQRLGEQAALTDWQHRLHVAQARVKEARGDRDGALSLLDEAERVYVRGPLPDVRPISALKARIWIRQGRLSEALAWMHTQGLSTDDALGYLSEFEHITLARLLVAQSAHNRISGIMQDALALLDRLFDAAKAGNRLGSVIEILGVQALAHQVQGDLSKAKELLAYALRLAEPQGYIRIFVDEGEPMVVLLREVAKRGLTSDYVLQLLASFDKQKGNLHPPKQALMEPLSERELDVLRMLRSELSGPEIANHLVISLNTLRTHTKSIYHKLGVNNRRSAIRRASELDLL